MELKLQNYQQIFREVFVRNVKQGYLVFFSQIIYINGKRFNHVVSFHSYWSHSLPLYDLHIRSKTSSGCKPHATYIRVCFDIHDRVRPWFTYKNKQRSII
jgi:hypothetical protein